MEKSSVAIMLMRNIQLRKTHDQRRTRTYNYIHPSIYIWITQLDMQIKAGIYITVCVFLRLALPAVMQTAFKPEFGQTELFRLLVR